MQTVALQAELQQATRHQSELKRGLLLTQEAKSRALKVSQEQIIEVTRQLELSGKSLADKDQVGVVILWLSAVLSVMYLAPSIDTVASCLDGFVHCQLLVMCCANWHRALLHHCPSEYIDSSHLPATQFIVSTVSMVCRSMHVLEFAVKTAHRWC